MNMLYIIFYGRDTIMASVLVQFRVDDEKKKRADKICKERGLDLNSAMKICFERLIIENGLPFEMKLDRMDDFTRAKSRAEKESEVISRFRTALAEAQDKAEKMGFSDLSDDEINDEIDRSRAERVAADGDMSDPGEKMEKAS
ncbi:MAG: type II toxin-antitoxin system RelB/DinJ family antitoxin [Clostridia bacterium]|nr:type II toxin-antitoxin system RelB/DinJ family antitoxin [Clostridia bacterium]